MKKILKYIIILSIFFIFIVFTPNLYVKNSVERKIKDDNYITIQDVDCIVVLGAGVWGDGPSPMLKDRLNKAIELYKLGVSPKIIMSGDHGTKEYDEVNIMKEYAIEEGVPSKDIFMDHAGFSTYDSMYRAKYIFGAKKIIVVTQEYHLFRALYIADKLGLDVVGVPAEKIEYSGQEMRNIREILARDKDFVKCLYKPKAKYLGEEISLKDSGDITNDKD